MNEPAFLQTLSDGSALYAVPGGQFRKGDVVKTERPVSFEHSATGEVLATARNGLAIVHWPRKRDPERVAIRKNPTPSTDITRSQTMTSYENILKAARADWPDYVHKGEWHAALERLAKSEKRSDESVEQAYARVAKQHPDGRAMRACYDRARPAPVVESKAEPEPAKSPAEKRLDELAKARAKESGETFEKAFAAVAKTEEGRRLRREAKA